MGKSILSNKPFIRISNGERGSDYKATLIEVGNYIKYNRNSITVLCESPGFTGELCRKVFTIRHRSSKDYLGRPNWYFL